MHDFARGERVRHPRHGPGTLEAKLVLGLARVRFDAEPSLLRTVERAELQPLDAPGSRAKAEAPALGRSARPAPHPLEPPLPHSRLARADAWQTLEALRLGVVPARGIAEYTVARERELGSISALLAAQRGARVIFGDYGTGKTHVLDVAEQLAREEGFATARITLDPREQGLHHPLRLYRHVAESLRTADSAVPGFEGLFERLVDSEEHYEPHGVSASRFFSPYLHALRHGNDADLGWLRDYVRGENVDAEPVNRTLERLRWRGPRVLRMSDYRTYGRMYVHLVGTLAAWCADAGARGLVLFFDEVERVDALARDDQQYAFEVLRHYAAVTMERADLAFDPEQLYKGGHEVHRAIPLRFRDDQPLCTVFALTPLPEILSAFREGVTRSSAYDLVLGGLERRVLPELVRRIGAVHARAYPEHELAEQARARICAEIERSFEEGHDSFRAAVRAAIFLLDAERRAGRGA